MKLTTWAYKAPHLKGYGIGREGYIGYNVYKSITLLTVESDTEAKR